MPGGTIYYTGKGDSGMTSLSGSNKVAKDSKIIKTLGQLDAVNTVLAGVLGRMEDIQNRLFRDLFTSIILSVFLYTNVNLITLIVYIMVLVFSGEMRKFFFLIPDSWTHQEISEELSNIMTNLYTISAELSGFYEFKKFSHENTEELEKLIKYFDDNTPKLTKFVVPGGCELSRCFHMARVEVRKLEIMLCKLGKEKVINENILSYCNRLSSYMFAAARYFNKLDNRNEPVLSVKK